VSAGALVNIILLASSNDTSQKQYGVRTQLDDLLNRWLVQQYITRSKVRGIHIFLYINILL